MPSPRTFMTTIGDREVPLEVEKTGPDRYRVSIEGQELVFDARRLGAKIVSMLVDNRTREVSVIRRGDDYDLLIGTRRFRTSLVPEVKARRRQIAGGAVVAGRQEIKASMPGKVVDVLVQVGDVVEPGHGLLVVEAMKMENEIKSAGAGEVKEIHARPGKAVETGDLLIVVE